MVLTPQSCRPASISLITSTQTVTLQPVTPGYVAPQEGVTPVTSYQTRSSTETITGTRTETLAISAASASAGAYTGLATNGWNSSMATFITVKSPAIGSVTIAEKYHPGTAYSMAPSGIVPFPPGNSTRHINIRDVANLVVATIDGVSVSWTNNYNYVGTFVSSSDTSSVVVPVTATALQYAPDSAPTSSTFSSPVHIDSSSPVAPTTTIAVYPWDVLPIASATNATTSHAVPSSLHSSKSTSSSTAVAAPAPSCGDASAEFMIDFDDLPAFSAGPGDTDIPPIFNPYHKLFFQQYFGYVPPPSDPFPPISPPQLAVYRADGSGAINSTDTGLELPGEIGSGPRASDSAYWIDAYSAYLGCANPGPESCSIMVKGYQSWSLASVITQGFSQAPCPGMKNCSLALVEFADGFRNLTGLQIVATVGIKPVDWYMDNLSLGWSNNTCAAQLERSSQE